MLKRSVNPDLSGKARRFCLIEMKSTPPWRGIGVVGAIFAFSAAASGKTAKGIIQKIAANYENQMKGVKDYTVVTDKSTTYHKRATVGGRTIYKTRSETEMMGKKFTTIYDGVYQWSVDPISGELKKEKPDYNPYQAWENLKDIDAEYVRTEKIDGNSAYVLRIEDMTKLMGTNKPEEMVEGSGKVWVDVKDLVMKKMEISAKIVDEEGQKRDVNTITRFEDFRKVDGMLIAYRTVTTIGGVAEEITPEQKQEMREGLAKMREELAKMPPEQRAMAEKMMKPQMEMMQKMLAGGGMETVIEVKDAKVNTGLSDALFDGSKLR